MPEAHFAVAGFVAQVSNGWGSEGFGGKEGKIMDFHKNVDKETKTCYS